MASNIPFCYFVFTTEEMTLLHGPTICRLKGQHRHEPGNRQEEGSEKKERKKSDCSHTEEGQAGGKQADCTPRLRSKGEGAVLKRPAGSDDPGRPRCTPARARRSGLTAITTDTITTPSRRQTGGSLSFQDENVSLWSPEARWGPENGNSRAPGMGATGPGNGSNRSRERATHGAVHGHFLPCTGMYRDRVRAYNVQYTTCTQKVVHFRECTGHVRDWTRFVCRSETPGFYRKPKISGKVCSNFSHGNEGF
ncbi:hypothetical protein Bbelb_379890 [Branchiostoma belcheri]|nr:hypothetical protein Bbelb_379890 [Branchiostoma belcheri]